MPDMAGTTEAPEEAKVMGKTGKVLYGRLFYPCGMCGINNVKERGMKCLRCQKEGSPFERAVLIAMRLVIGVCVIAFVLKLISLRGHSA